MEEIYVIFLIAIVLLIWLKTDALVEWGSILRLSKILKTKEFHNYKMGQLLGDNRPIDITYPTFLKLNYNSFFTRLISCPVCLSFWLSIIGCIIISNPIVIPIVYIMSLILYGIVVKLVIKS